MNYRRFGRTGWQVSDIGYGMWGMGGGWTGSDDAEAMALVDRFSLTEEDARSEDNYALRHTCENGHREVVKW